MHINRFKQLKLGYVVSHPSYLGQRLTIDWIEAYSDHEHGMTSTTHSFSTTTAEGHPARMKVVDERDVRLLRLHTAIPPYDEDRSVINIDLNDVEAKTFLLGNDGYLRLKWQGFEDEFPIYDEEFNEEKFEIGLLTYSQAKCLYPMTVDDLMEIIKDEACNACPFDQVLWINIIP